MAYIVWGFIGVSLVAVVSQFGSYYASLRSS